MVPLLAACCLFASINTAGVNAACNQQPLDDRAAHDESASDAWRIDVAVSLATQRDGETRTRESAYVVRRAPGAVRIDLGRVAVHVQAHAQGATLTAWHAFDPGSAFVAHGRDPAALLRAHLPTLWSTPIAEFVAADQNPFPLVGHAWPTAPEKSMPTPGHSVESAEGITIERVREPQTGHIQREEIRAGHADHAFTLTMSYTWAPVKDPQGWLVDVASRTHAPSIAALAPRPAVISVGDPVTMLRVFGPDGAAWNLAQAFEPEPGATFSRRANLLALVLTSVLPREGDSVEPVALADVVAFIDARRSEHAIESAQRNLPRQRVIVRVAAVFDVPTFEPGQLEAIAAIARAATTDPLLAGVESSIPSMLSTHPPRETIDLFAPGASTVVIVVDSGLRLVAAVPIDIHRDQWRTELTRVLSPAMDDSGPQGVSD
jgi:hypothetical protein